MKKNIINIGISLIVIFILSICFSSSSNAAIESKPGQAIHVLNTANTEFMYCYNMRSSTSTLANNTLDPHMMLNVDYGAAVYLGASAYGDVRNATGKAITIQDTNYYSLTDNKTGVMDFALNGSRTRSSGGVMSSFYTRTAGILDEATNDNANTSILYNFRNTKYVDKLTGESDTKGMAILETNAWYGSSNTIPKETQKNVTCRYNNNNMFSITTSGGSQERAGIAMNATTYRAVIWN